LYQFIQVFGLFREDHQRDTILIRHEFNPHIKNWHHLQQKTLKQ